MQDYFIAASIRTSHGWSLFNMFPVVWTASNDGWSTVGFKTDSLISFRLRENKNTQNNNEQGARKFQTVITCKSTQRAKTL